MPRSPRRSDPHHDTGTAVVERAKARTAKPRMWRVLLHNDDFTTQEFVIAVLTTVFNKQESEAVELMLDVHFRGACLAGVYTREVAETKVDTVEKLAQAAEFPFLATMEPDDDAGRGDTSGHDS